MATWMLGARVVTAQMTARHAGAVRNIGKASQMRVVVETSKSIPVGSAQPPAKVRRGTAGSLQKIRQWAANLQASKHHQEICFNILRFKSTWIVLKDYPRENIVA